MSKGFTGRNFSLAQFLIFLIFNFRVDETSQPQQVIIFNHNRIPITCEWSKYAPEKSSKRSSETDDSNPLRHSGSTNDSENYEFAQISEYNSIQNFPIEEVQEKPINICDIIMKPSNKFTIPASSEFTCEVKITGTKPGPVEDVIYLLINDGSLQLELPIRAEVAEKEFSVSPSVLGKRALATS